MLPVPRCLGYDFEQIVFGKVTTSVDCLPTVAFATQGTSPPARAQCENCRRKAAGGGTGDWITAPFAGMTENERARGLPKTTCANAFSRHLGWEN
jgi:hypothetical protein